MTTIQGRVDVSVLTPSFNYGRFIGDALTSVREQGGLAVQHVVQDAESSDDTRRVLRRFQPEPDWLSEPDRGQSDALNKALSRAEGEWVSWLNADEFYMPGGLKALVDAADRSGADVVYGDAVFIDRAGRLLQLVPQHPFHEYLLRWYGCYIASCTTLFRRSALGDAPWDPEMKLAMDWDLYLRLRNRGARFAYVPYPVGAFRVHEDQVIAQPIERHREDFRKLARRYGVMGPGLRKLGRWPHDVYKLFDGAYPRQIKASRMKGADMRWFASSTGAANSDFLLVSGYRGSPTTVSDNDRRVVGV